MRNGGLSDSKSAAAVGVAMTWIFPDRQCTQDCMNRNRTLLITRPDRYQRTPNDKWQNKRKVKKLCQLSQEGNVAICLRRLQKLKATTDLASHWIDMNKWTDIPHGHESCNDGKGLAALQSQSLGSSGIQQFVHLANDCDRKFFDWHAEWPKFPWYFIWLIRACFGQKGPLIPIILSLFW